MIGFHSNNRRQHQRVSVKLAAICRIEGPQKYLHILDGNEFETKTQDMSDNGISILSHYFIPPGSKLHIKLMVCEPDSRTFIKFYDIVHLYGHVVSSVVHDEKTFRIGIRFDEMDRTMKDKIFYIMHSSLQQGNPYPFANSQ